MGIGVGDRRGNSVSFLHFPATSIYFRGNDSVTEQVSILFTTKVNEARVMEISRSVNYPDSAQASLSDLSSAISQKYGIPSYEHRKNIQSLRNFTLHYVWFEGRRIKLTEEQIAREQYSSPPSPAKCLNASVNAYSFANNRRDDAPGCSAYMSIEISLGKRDDLVKSMSVRLRDYRRGFENNVDTDKFLIGELEKKVKGAAPGTKPRL